MLEWQREPRILFTQGMLASRGALLLLGLGSPLEELTGLKPQLTSGDTGIRTVSECQGPGLVGLGVTGTGLLH